MIPPSGVESPPRVLCPAGSRARADILRLVATLLVLQMMRVKKLEEGTLLRTLFSLVDSSRYRLEQKLEHSGAMSLWSQLSSVPCDSLQEQALEAGEESSGLGLLG